MNREINTQTSVISEKVLPERLYMAEQVRMLDQEAIRSIPIDGFELMKKAGRAAFRSLLRHWSGVSSVSIFAGGGNNGGDGLVIAGLAAQQGMTVELFLLIDPISYKAEAATAWQWLQQLSSQLEEPQRLRVKSWKANEAIGGEVIVDCLLGTGLSGPVRGDYEAVINSINQCSLPVLAVDIPSGVCSDTGRILGCAIKADHTITFIGLKQGMLTGEAPDCVGELEYDALGVPESVFQRIDCSVLRADWGLLKIGLPRRKRTAHKGGYGRVLLIGGDYGMAGAITMASEAACRVGAGLIHTATRPEHVSALVSQRPEVMVKGIAHSQDIEAMLAATEVVVIGPGLGQGAWGRQLFQKALLADKLMVIDADGLNLLAQQSVTPRASWILTPHPGEAARLLACSTEDIEQDRFKAVVALQKKYGGTVILKGAGTLIAVPDDKKGVVVWLANTGNPGMASGGMGDVLSGILGGLLAQKNIGQHQVAPLAVTLHGEAANAAANSVGEYSLLASDVIAAIPALLKGV